MLFRSLWAVVERFFEGRDLLCGSEGVQHALLDAVDHRVDALHRVLAHQVDAVEVQTARMPHDLDHHGAGDERDQLSDGDLIEVIVGVQVHPHDARVEFHLAVEGQTDQADRGDDEVAEFVRDEDDEAPRIMQYLSINVSISANDSTFPLDWKEAKATY